jgi:hypothetical protein
MSEAAKKDAVDCARHLVRLRVDKDWNRFDIAVDNFLIRHKDRLSTGTLRTALADAYLAVASTDDGGRRRILKADTL